jgi:hypothetical protein
MIVQCDVDLSAIQRSNRSHVPVASCQNPNANAISVLSPLSAPAVNPFVTSYWLNSSYDFVQVYDGQVKDNLPPHERIRPHTSEIYVACRHLGDIARSFKFFQKKDLYMLCDFYHIRDSVARSTIKSLVLSILCATPPSGRLPVLVFRERSRPRELTRTDMRLLTINLLSSHVEDARLRHNSNQTRCRHLNRELAARHPPASV